MWCSPSHRGWMPWESRWKRPILTRKLLGISRNTVTDTDGRKLLAILRHVGGQLVHHAHDNRSHRWTVASDGRELLEDGSVQFGLLRLGKIQLGRERFYRHPVPVTQPERVPRTYHVLRVETDDAKLHVRKC